LSKRRKENKERNNFSMRRKRQELVEFREQEDWKTKVD